MANCVAYNDWDIQIDELHAIERHLIIERKRKRANNNLIDYLQKRADEINKLIKEG